MTSVNDIELLILAFLDSEVLGSSGQNIDLDENLFVSGQVDSLAIMRLVAHLETTLDLEIPPSDLIPDNFRTVRVMAEYLVRLTSVEAR